MKKSNIPKRRWATRFKSDHQKSKKVRKGPQTHLGKLTPKTEVMPSEEVFAENPLIQGAGPVTTQSFTNVKQAPQAVPAQQMVRTTGRGG